MEVIERLQVVRRALQIINEIHRPIRDHSDPISKYSAEEFEQRYRLSKEIFFVLNDTLNIKLKHTNRGNPIHPTLQIAIALRHFATGSFQLTTGDLKEFNVSQPTVSRIVTNVSKVIATRRHQYIRFPNDIMNVQRKFYEMRRLPGVIGALDCSHIKIANPGGNNAETYRNRKGTFSLNCQVVAGPQRQIFSACVMWPGSVHDSRIFRNSELYRNLENREIQTGHLLGDSAYPCKYFLLTPILNPRTPAEIMYNNAQRGTRITVECCFGVIKRRFPCLDYKLRTKLETSISIIVACFVLHNFAILHNNAWDFDNDIMVLPDEILHIDDDDMQGRAKRQSIIDNYFS